MSLSSLQPRPLWQWFETICSIPHPSKHEAALKAVITKWASAEQLSFTEDSAGNLIIKKPATPGFEQAATVALQAHLDMVPQKNSGIDHDFTQDPIQPYIDGDWVTAKDTTLGADNGIGMASCLALLASKDVTHGPLEVLLTADEEAGMSGAFGLQAGVLSAQYLINTDSEEEGDVFMGCAGGVDISATLQKQTQPFTPVVFAVGEWFDKVLVQSMQSEYSAYNMDGAMFTMMSDYIAVAAYQYMPMIWFVLVGIVGIQGSGAINHTSGAAKGAASTTSKGINTGVRAGKAVATKGKSEAK